MKYDDYKKLTPEQKEEWNFKYKDIQYPYIDIKFSLLTYSAMVSMIFVVIYAITQKLEGMEKYLFADMISLFFKISMIMLILFVFDYIGQFIYYIYKTIQERKFIRGCIKNVR